MPTGVELHVLLGILNTSLIRYLLNLLNPTVNFQTGDAIRLPRIPVSETYTSQLAALARSCVTHKTNILAKRPESRHFSLAMQQPMRGEGLLDYLKRQLRDLFEEETAQCLAEGESDRPIYTIYELPLEVAEYVWSEIGRPPGTLPCIPGEGDDDVVARVLLDGTGDGCVSGGSTDTTVDQEVHTTDDDEDLEEMTRGIGLFRDGFVEGIAKATSRNPARCTSGAPSSS